LRNKFGDLINSIAASKVCTVDKRWYFCGFYGLFYLLILSATEVYNVNAFLLTAAMFNILKEKFDW
jgi:hypothetical protein